MRPVDAGANIYLYFNYPSKTGEAWRGKKAPGTVDTMTPLDRELDRFMSRRKRANSSNEQDALGNDFPCKTFCHPSQAQDALHSDYALAPSCLLFEYYRRSMSAKYRTLYRDRWVNGPVCSKYPSGVF